MTARLLYARQLSSLRASKQVTVAKCGLVLRKQDIASAEVRQRGFVLPFANGHFQTREGFSDTELGVTREQCLRTVVQIRIRGPNDRLRRCIALETVRLLCASASAGSKTMPRTATARRVLDCVFIVVC